MKSNNQKINFGEEAAGGLSAGVVGTVIGFPLDLVKTRMQTGTVVPNKGIIGIASQIVRSEGMFALYKGIGPPLISLSILNTLSFTSYSYFRELYGGNNGWDIRNGLAGMTGSPAFGIVSTVENFIKTQMQMDNTTHKRFPNSWACLTTLSKEHGPQILYTGHVVNTIREAAFTGFYFFVYEGFRQILVETIDPKIAVPVAGGLAGATSWGFSFPLDCVRAGVQGHDLQQSKQQQQHKKRAMDVFRELMKTKGIRGLYSGVGPSIARAFLVSGSRFSAYEGALWLIRGGRDARR